MVEGLDHVNLERVLIQIGNNGHCWALRGEIHYNSICLAIVQDGVSLKVFSNQPIFWCFTMPKGTIHSIILSIHLLGSMFFPSGRGTNFFVSFFLWAYNLALIPAHQKSASLPVTAQQNESEISKVRRPCRASSVVTFNFHQDLRGLLVCWAMKRNIKYITVFFRWNNRSWTLMYVEASWSGLWPGLASIACI